MSYDEIRTGTVVEYQFLWSREADRGETEGRKPRPTAVAYRVERKDHSAVYLMPITSRSPLGSALGVEIPEIEKRRAGLDSDLRLWIIIDEINFDIIPHSHVLEPDAKIGKFGKPFFQKVLKLWIANFKRTKTVSRLD
ncbi:hypothetical protein [Nitratireductor sp. XY-223]|uniref:hypothetical protein n=1 Tax=Nitratireductor sp. XY-223 TaxID=2561926 RepID=UPI0010AB243A|nr:hypothetical protein [Nitratireductor sp. XY-223]